MITGIEPGKKSKETFLIILELIIVSAVYKTEGDKDETHESLKDDELEAGKKKEYFMWDLMRLICDLTISWSRSAFRNKLQKLHFHCLRINFKKRKSIESKIFIAT